MTMKDIYVIEIHSFVDTITNSSSELYVLKPGKNIELIRGALQEMMDAYVAVMGPEYNYIRQDIDEVIIIREHSGGKVEESWDGISAPEGSIIIQSAMDNSIPYFIGEFLNTHLNATHERKG